MTNICLDGQKISENFKYQVYFNHSSDWCLTDFGKVLHPLLNVVCKAVYSAKENINNNKLHERLFHLAQYVYIGCLLPLSGLFAKLIP